MTENKLKCNSCGHDVGEATSFCPACGRAAGPSPTTGRAGDLYLLLMTANVLRLRHQWALAEAKCSEALNLDPDSASACSVMGDVLRDQGREEDAIEWYKMAVDRDPASEGDRKKLEALIDHRFSAQPEPRLRPSLAAVKKWAKSASDEVRAARPICPWAMVTAAIFAVTLLAAFTLVLVGKRTTPPTVVPNESVGGVFATEAAYQGAETAPPPEPKPTEITGDITALEAGILEQLRRRATELDPNCQVNAVRIDPKAATAEVEMSMPAYWSPASARKEIGRMAAALAVACVKADNRLVCVHMRTCARQSANPDQLVMTSDGVAEELRKHGEAASSANLESVFSAVWWSPAIAPENDASASSPPFDMGRGAAPRGR